MNRLVLAAVGALVAISLLASTLTAQVTRIPGSGCTTAAGGNFPTTTGSPAIGQGFGVTSPPCRNPADRPFVALGDPLRPTPLDPYGCIPNCILVVSPWLTIPASSWRIVIPNNPRLVGMCFVVQCGCVDPGSPTHRPCVQLSGGLQVCITR